MWRWRAIGAGVLALVVLVAVGFVVPSLRHTLVSRWRHAGSDRSGLVVHGAAIWAHDPITGVGVGGFKHAYAERQHLRGKDPKKAASHDAPVTVAAELGTPGLLLFAWLLGAALAAGLGRPRETVEGRIRIAGSLLLVAIFAHSLFYADFFEDPFTWGALALIAAVATSERVRT